MSCPAATPNRCIQKHLSHSYVRVQRRYDSLRETSYRLHLQTAKIQEQARNGEILQTYPRRKESASNFKGNQPGDYRDLRIPADHSHSKRAAKAPESCGKGVERTIHSPYEKLSFAQGKLLIKLVDRQTHSTSYELVKAFMGPFKAGFYQTFAALFGASLKKQYDPTGDDALTERVILLVESGQL